jgi:hypothetical protein
MYTGGQRMKIYFLLLVASPQETLETLMSRRALRGRAITRGYFGFLLLTSRNASDPVAIRNVTYISKATSISGTVCQTICMSKHTLLNKHFDMRAHT